MDLWKKIENREATIGVVGLGYVGLPLALILERKFKVVGLDVNQALIERLNNGVDKTGEVDEAELKASKIQFTMDPSVLADCQVIIATVPTPIDDANNPDLGPVRSASETIGKHIRPGTVAVFESTVYPGVTEEVCGPIIEAHSGLVSGKDFFLGYSPERINPGDKVNRVDKIVKVVSGQNDEVLDLLARIYGAVITAGVYPAKNIKTAEAAKVIENTQRDLNIALMNELAVLFNEIGIDTLDVIETAATKWNFLKFYPGLVGGHCIGVDPYYLTHLAQKIGYHPRVILAGRRINSMIPKFVAEQTVKAMIRGGTRISDAKVLMMGLTFKENVPDLRNSKSFDVINELREYGIELYLNDPIASPEALDHEYGEAMSELNGHQADAMILAVKHQEYLDQGLETLTRSLRPGGVFVDVKGVFTQEQVEALGFAYWRL